jgi:hypothetical protein
MNSQPARRHGRSGEPGGASERLPEGWVCGRDCEVGGPPGGPIRVELVLMHPRLGVALLDTQGRDEVAEDWVGVLRERLVQARFETIFGGNLPILQGSVRPEDLPSLPQLVREAFEQLLPLTVRGEEAWVSTMTRLVVPADRGWTDSPYGLPPRLSDDGRRQGPLGLEGGPVPVLPMRRAAPVEDRQSGFERFPRPKVRRDPLHWLRMGGTCLGLAAVIGALAWFVAPPDEPAVMNAAGTIGTVGISDAPVGTSTAAVPVQPMAAPNVGARAILPPVAGQVPGPAAPSSVAEPPARGDADAAEELPLPPPAPSPPPPSKKRSGPASRQQRLDRTPTAARATPAADGLRRVLVPLRSRAAVTTRRKTR